MPFARAFAAIALDELPQYWRDCKAHADVIDGDIPVSFVLTSASLHDSQAAIPLAQMTAERVATSIPGNATMLATRRRRRP